MALGSNLLKSVGGLHLAPEICLLVSEFLMMDDARAVRKLLLTSKEFYHILTAYQKSICKALCPTIKHFNFANAIQEQITFSHLVLGEFTATRLTYPWICEIQRRSHIIDVLSNHPLTDMEDLAHRWPSLDGPDLERRKRIAVFKQQAFHLLFKLADLTAELEYQSTSDIRASQADFLDGLTTLELATLGVIVEVCGQNYFTITTKALESNPPATPPRTNRTRIPFTTTYVWQLSSPNSISLQTGHDYRISECMCVFEDLVQRHGPYFAWAYFVEGSDLQYPRPDLWARELMEDGLEYMNAFEMGYTMSYASLQSVVWKIFCRKMVCEMQESWGPAKGLVEEAMKKYEIEGEC